ncbi:MAG: ABC transporter ATP-binding protein [Planctomycetes bacterium]|jgi:putative ABC transport system ATP-binding protein|nr:ABC transporter ATP-binding protein [Planctomycetota bacterium]MBT6452490.1 ABC transporter ATP-binding protein [Planctomycetota bacterium]MBT6541244.1 ABC transporter ATP-binding protein [Planctomycetota bacterium]MBT6785680.1 ABC transporter ATP-binding protein [Planctomycetota bacterium]MBT6969055.1 ABC transporter ATP-binding protein [Planctomycetota bacterium]
MTGSSVSVIDLVHRHVGQQHPVRVEKIAIEAGEKVAIMGPSGCGKTTLLSCIAGILSPSSGEVQVGEIRIDQLSDARRRKFRREHIGLVFQEFELLEHIDVMENSFLPLWLDGREPTEEEQAKLIERSRRCGIEDLLHRKPRALSQGERQRAAVCRALMTSPSLILADEPTGSLDGASGRAVLDLLFEEADLTGATVIVVTHDSTILDGFDRVEALAGSAS